VKAVRPVRRTAFRVLCGRTAGGGCGGVAAGAAAPGTPSHARCPAQPDQGACPLNPVSAAAALCQPTDGRAARPLTQGRPRRPITAPRPATRGAARRPPPHASGSFCGAATPVGALPHRKSNPGRGDAVVAAQTRHATGRGGEGGRDERATRALQGMRGALHGLAPAAGAHLRLRLLRPVPGGPETRTDPGADASLTRPPSAGVSDERRKEGRRIRTQPEEHDRQL
jgi:hypothetical protein